MEKIEIGALNAFTIQLNVAGQTPMLLTVNTASSAAYKAVSETYTAIKQEEVRLAKAKAIPSDADRAAAVMSCIADQCEIIKACIQRVILPEEWKELAKIIDFIPYKTLSEINGAITKAVSDGFIEDLQGDKV